MAKTSKTYTLENDTIKTVSRYKEYKELSSDSAALERIILEWNTLTTNNIQGLPIDQVVDIIISKMSDVITNVDIKEVNKEQSKAEKKSDMDNAILDGFNNIPEEYKDLKKKVSLDNLLDCFLFLELICN